MILSDGDIRRAQHDGRIRIEPFIEFNVQPASLDLCLDNRFRVFTTHDRAVSDLKREPDTGELYEADEFFILHPGEFALASTVEWVEIGRSLVAQVNGKSSLGRVGLQVHATAGYVDPGFKGNLTLELSNVSRLPIKMYPGQRVCQIVFMELTNPAVHAYGEGRLRSHYQGQTGPTPSRFTA